MLYLWLIAIVLLTLCLLGRKWELKPAYYIPWSLLMAVLACGTVFLASGAWPSAAAPFSVAIGLTQAYLLTAGCLLYFFFRDPERMPPAQEKCIVSPADGRVVYVKEIENGTFPFAVKGSNRISLAEFTEENLIPARGIQIGIAMNFLNVHVNRSPIDGAVQRIRRIPGKFASLKHISSLLENERVLMVTEGDGIRLGLVQIASRLVRRIVSYVDEGDEVAQGQRIGMIRFGSQVDVLIPQLGEVQATVQVGEEVHAGESIIATY